MSESEIIKVYQEGIQSVVNLVQGLSTQISELSQTVEKQSQIIAKQNKTISDLDARLKKLEKQSNKTTQNSSLPPSTDGFKKTKSLRQPSNKKTGGQVGHKGSTLKMVEDPDLVVTHDPQTCQGYGCRLENVEPQKTIRRQVFDLSPLNIQVSEHQALIKVCPNCHYKNEGQFPKHVTQPTQYGPHLTSVLSYLSHYQLIPFNRLKQLTQDIFGVTISQETLVNMTKRFYELLETTEASIKENLLASSYLHLDETGCYVNGILPSFKGTVIHDHWTPYFKYDDCTHALCNVHHLREFKGIIEFENQQWAKDMTELLLEAKTYSEETEYPLPRDKVQEFEQRYQKIIEEGYLANPLKAYEKNTDSVRLLNRLSKRQEKVLEFLYQVEVPFDNNLVERDRVPILSERKVSTFNGQRMTKTKQKISGCFRTEKGFHCFARIRGFISTCQKQRLTIIESIETILRGNTIQFS